MSQFSRGDYKCYPYLPKWQFCLLSPFIAVVFCFNHFIEFLGKIKQIGKLCILIGKYCMVLWHSTSDTLRWRNDGRDSVSNHQPRDCLLKRLFRRRSKKITKLRVTGLCAGNSPGTGEFSAQMASNAKNVSIWWRHHVIRQFMLLMSVSDIYQLYPIWLLMRSEIHE